jgi:hypothetical protein
VRQVVDGELLVNDAVTLDLGRSKRRLPAARLMLSDSPTTWLIPNARGMRHMVEATGYEPREHGGPYRLPYGRGRETSPVDPVEAVPPGPWITYPLRAARHRAAARGFPHAWVLAAPRPSAAR